MAKNFEELRAKTSPERRARNAADATQLGKELEARSPSCRHTSPGDQRMKLHLEMTGDGPARWLYPQVPVGLRWHGLPDLLHAADGTEEHPHYVEKVPERTFVRVGILSEELQKKIDQELNFRRQQRELEEQQEALKKIPKPGVTQEELDALPNAVEKLRDKLEDPEWLIGVWEGFNQLVVVTSEEPPQNMPKRIDGFQIRVVTDSKLVPFPRKT